jgi:predicted negative regulator of RcsB-dependent stress response
MTLVLTALITGCSVEKNTGASRFYNSLIAKYNVWFNGNEAYKAGVEKIQRSHRDDYSVLIPVFEYTSAESAAAAASDMERAAQKASKVIALYSITAKPKEKSRRGDDARDEEFYNRREYNEWVDDAYLLLAKAQFYLKNLPAARSAFSFTVSIATDPDLVSEANIWMARIQTEEGNYSEALRILQGFTDIDGLPKSLQPMLYSTQADVALRQKRYSDAVSPLTLAVENSTNKQFKVRLTYLLAQVCKETGDNSLSTRYFRDVIRMNPPYELEFNAAINLAGVTDLSHGDAEDLIKSLRRMLRDSKNKDYLDQIYFALGELEMRMGNTGEALNLWTQAARSSTVNTRQRARAYLALGEHYYTEPDYMTSFLYYDTASYLIDDRYPDYNFISRRTDDLGEYADFHRVVITEDSLRRVALMNTTERDALISELIRTYEAEQTKAAQGDGSDRYNMGLYYENEQRYQGAISAEGGWYFYNQSALTFGRTEFRRRWGDRRLEDNWRRLNKARAAFTAPTPAENGEEQPTTDSTAKAPERTKEYYLRNLPLTDSLMRLSVSKSANAMLGEGKILASRLADTLLAAKSLATAAAPGNSDNIRTEALYELFRLLRNYDPARAELFRAELLSSYPDSEYSLILSDPDYVRKQLEMSTRAKTSYEAAYEAFVAERYTEAQDICREAAGMFPGDDLLPKFMLLDAMATGATTGELAYKEKLDSLTVKYPETPEGKRAAEITAYLKKEIPALQIAEDTRIAEELYEPDTIKQHFVIVVAENIQANMNQMVFDIINYNLDNFTEKNYRTEGKAVDTDYILISIGTFENAAEAGKWLRAFDPLTNMREAENAAVSLYIISRDNLEKLNIDKNIARYRIFYENAYRSEK